MYLLRKKGIYLPIKLIWASKKKEEFYQGKWACHLVGLSLSLPDKKEMVKPILQYLVCATFTHFAQAVQPIAPPPPPLWWFPSQ